MHHTKEKGDLGVLKAQLDLHQQGWIVCVPLTEHASFDLVACNDEKILRIQVKYRELKHGALSICFRTNWADKNGVHTNKINKNSVDRYCIYCPDTDKCYYFDPKDFNQSVTLRVVAPKNNQKSRLHLVETYEKLE